MVGGFSKKHRLRMGGCPSLRCRNLFRMPLTGHLREAHQIWLRLGFHQDLSEKTRKVKNQIQMMSPEKSVNEINPYFTNLVLKRFKKTVQKTYSLRWLPWILVAKMLVTIGFNVGFHLYPWSAVDQTSRGSLDLDFLGYNFHPLNPCGSIRQVGFDRRLRTGVLGNSRSLQVVITYSLPWFTVTRAAHSHVRNTVRLKLQKSDCWDGATWRVLFSSEGRHLLK